MPMIALPPELTRDVLFGLNILSLAGFIVMGIGLNVTRTRRASAPVGIALMTVGTALVFAGLYLKGA
jgi:hypothetical protein